MLGGARVLIATGQECVASGRYVAVGNAPGVVGGEEAGSWPTMYGMDGRWVGRWAGGDGGGYEEGRIIEGDGGVESGKRQNEERTTSWRRGIEG
jgi:hypothetical protein